MNKLTFGRVGILTGLVVFGLGTASETQAQRHGRSVDADREGPRGGSVSVDGSGYGRYRSGSVDVDGANGGSYDASGTRFGRFGTGSASAEGPNGGTYDASGTRAGRFGTGSVDANGANGGSVDASAQRWGPYRSTSVDATSVNGNSVNVNNSVRVNDSVHINNVEFNGYRSGYVYRGGSYVAVATPVGAYYAAPIGAYAGWQIMTEPYYVTYPVYATYPVETAVQVQLEKQGYYDGDIDGQIDADTQQAISKYQAANGLQVTGTINKALLVSLGIQSA